MDRTKKIKICVLFLFGVALFGLNFLLLINLPKRFEYALITLFGYLYGLLSSGLILYIEHVDAADTAAAGDP